MRRLSAVVTDRRRQASHPPMPPSRSVRPALPVATVAIVLLIAACASSGGTAGTARSAHRNPPSTSSGGRSDTGRDVEHDRRSGGADQDHIDHDFVHHDDHDARPRPPRSRLPRETGDLASGSDGSRTQAVQQALRDQKLRPGHGGRQFGLKTTESVWAWQALHGLPRTGIVTPDMERLILGRYAQPMLRPGPRPEPHRDRSGPPGAPPVQERQVAVDHARLDRKRPPLLR